MTSGQQRQGSRPGGGHVYVRADPDGRRPTQYNRTHPVQPDPITRRNAAAAARPPTGRAAADSLEVGYRLQSLGPNHQHQVLHQQGQAEVGHQRYRAQSAVMHEGVEQQVLADPDHP